MSFFKASLNVGSIGEAIYYHAHEGKLERLDGRKADFKCMSTGDLYELKTDVYPMEKTPNMFIEVFSDNRKLTTGGPYRAEENECKYFCYMFIQNLTVFKFATKELIQRMQELSHKLKVSLVPNGSYTTEGFLVPRELLKDIYRIEKLEVRIKNGTD